METDTDISMIVLYDHEEVGSSSAVGAASPIMADAIRRITAALQNDDPDIYDAVIQRSFVLSSDQAHAVHPNYASKHEKAHQPVMNRGMVIKRNANQRYATTTITGAVLREVARLAKIGPIQEFVVRQDCGCGSTIGPVISAATGIRTGETVSAPGTARCGGRRWGRRAGMSGSTRGRMGVSASLAGRRTA